MLTLIENGNVFAPAPMGRASVLLIGDRVAKVGVFDGAHLDALAVPVVRIDATDCVVTPAFIDPHEHLIGAGGQYGFETRQPEVSPAELAHAGIATVVGCLGTDGVTRTMGSLFGKAKQLEHLGFRVFLYTGGFGVPHRTLTQSVENDLVFVDQVIGLGELAVGDLGGHQLTTAELARIVSSVRIAGKIAGKRGVTHFHLGPEKTGLQQLHALLDGFTVHAENVYPTHINRRPDITDDAIVLARRGCYVDMDTVDDNFAPTLAYYLDQGGPSDKLTISSDAQTQKASPSKLRRGFLSAVRELNLPIDRALSFFTSNTAAALGLKHKGHLREGCEADVLVMNERTLELQHFFSRGRRLVSGGELHETLRS